MTSLDTNVVLRFLLGDIPTQTAKATAVITNDKVYVTDVVVIEALFVLEKVYLLSRADIVELITSFLSLEGVLFNDWLLPDTLALYAKHRQLSAVDCYELVEARVYKNQLATFDKALARRGGAYVHAL